MEKMRESAPIVLRVGIALVFLWFGYNQVSDPSLWVGVIPTWYTDTLNVSATTLVLLNGWFEIVFGSLLLLGIFTRVSALLLSLHMLHVTFTVGYNGIGVRDFGLAMGTIAAFLYGTDNLCVDKFFKKYKNFNA